VTTTTTPARPVDTIELRSTDYGCAVCKQVFGSMRDFNAHQKVNYHQRPAVTCIDPGNLGLQQDHRGIWRSPAAIAKNAAFGERVHGAQKARELLSMSSLTEKTFRPVQSGTAL
jgi:hypothetical protein